MIPVRVFVFDRAPSIRALLKRTVGASGNSVCVGELPTSSLLESRFARDSMDVMVIGVDRDEIETFSVLGAAIKRFGKPTVILTPDWNSGRSVEKWPENCVILEKPTSPNGWEALCSSLVSMLQGLGPERSRPGIDEEANAPVWQTELHLIAIGGSAGGPEATGEMLTSVGEVLGRTSVVIVQHIGAGFEDDYVRWLGRMLPWMDVGIATEGEHLLPGQARLAGPESHLEISNDMVCHLDRESPPINGHRPSVDRLFLSLARSKPVGSVGVLLSGMGDDGVQGLLDLSRAGGLTLVQNQATSTVFGMPGAAIKRGAAVIAQSPTVLGSVLKSYIERGTRS